jgi:hypothetical protein
MFEQQVSQNGRCFPSSASPTPTDYQAQCKHPFEELLWTTNDRGQYGRCGRCDLKHVFYWSRRRGILMVQEGETKNDDVEHQQAFTGNAAAGLAVADSGCRAAVAGKAWHMSFQRRLRELNLPWREEAENEVFQFGAGASEVSSLAFIYPVGIGGKTEALRMSCVQGGPGNCPGLVGPSELARWRASFNFAEKTIAIGEKSQMMVLTATRRPALDLLDFGQGLGEAEKVWQEPRLARILETLKKTPQSLAFLTDPPVILEKGGLHDGGGQ